MPAARQQDVRAEGMGLRLGLLSGGGEGYVRETLSGTAAADVRAWRRGWKRRRWMWVLALRKRAFGRRDGVRAGLGVRETLMLCDVWL